MIFTPSRRSSRVPAAPSPIGMASRSISTRTGESSRAGIKPSRAKRGRFWRWDDFPLNSRSMKRHKTAGAMKRRRGIAWFVALSALAAVYTPAQAEPRHGISLFGDLKYPATFTHFDYVNPDAPKGGTVKYAAIGTFDTLNPFQLKGNKEGAEGMIFDTLMTPAEDEAGSEYGLVAESADVAPDKT